MELKEIQNLIRFVAKSGATEVKLEMKDIKLTIKTGPGKTETTIFQQPSAPQIPINVQAVSPDPPIKEDANATQSKQEEAASEYLEIKSPIIGTFYRKA
jgi:acetyl-CoA carboxylase biotin carboxyl carrier protein